MDSGNWPVDVPDGSDIPKNGLVLWLDANDIDADGEFDAAPITWGFPTGRTRRGRTTTPAKPRLRTNLKFEVVK